MNLEQIKELMRGGDVAAAAEELKALISAEPGNQEAKLLYGTCCHISGDDATFVKIDEEVAKDPDFNHKRIYRKYHAMRVAACGWVAQSLDEALDLARQTAEVSHNSDEGIRGAQAVAAGVFLARTGHPKAEVGRWVEEHLGYDFSPTVDEIRRTADHSYNCNVSIPQAFCCWLQSETYEETVRNAVSLATDADTIAAIAGALAAATPGMEIPQAWADKAFSLLKPDLKAILRAFYERYVD